MDKPDSDEIGYYVAESDREREEGLYSYLINRDGFESTEYDFKNGLRYVSFAKVSELKEYGTNIFNEKTTAFYRQNTKIVIPDCFSLYNFNHWASAFDHEIKYAKLDEVSGCSYDVVYCSMTAKKDLHLRNPYLTGGQREFKKGDNMCSVSVYYNGDLIAHKQTVVGSECANVLATNVGDVELVFSTVVESKMLTGTQIVTDEELYDIQEYLNADIFHTKHKK